ncbi:MAG: hypothetical protein KAT05_09115 [Spirochaetes bacterium]|nr:hypothetical protein [Spirochaetota bacterium]
MNKIIFFTIVLGMMLLSGCTVNDNIGLITIINPTTDAVKNIKLGKKLLVGYLAPGVTIDYYFFTEIMGGLNSKNATSCDQSYNLKDGTFTLKPGYWFNLTVHHNDGSPLIELKVQRKQARDPIKDGPDDYLDGGYYEEKEE